MGRRRRSDNTAAEAPAEKGLELIEFEPAGRRMPSSDEFLSGVVPAGSADALAAEPQADAAAAVDEAELSPVFRELALPKLPPLERENRARLQMQSPNRLHFYWSIRTNPFQTLNKALGAATSSYTLALRLIDLGRDAEELHTVDAEGDWWFNVDADSQYRAEIGFYAPNRPFVRVLYSNTVRTPRKSPSPRAASDADWRIPAQKFAKVLDVSGFRQDAFDVAIAGDDRNKAEDSTRRAFARLASRNAEEFGGIDTDELRYAMLSLAAGASLEQLRFRVSERIFALLQSFTDGTTPSDALAALKSEFDIDEDELLEETAEHGPDVFGASLVNFPKRARRLRARPRGFEGAPRFEPISSPGLR